MHYLEGNATLAAMFLKTAKIQGNYGALVSSKLGNQSFWVPGEVWLQTPSSGTQNTSRQQSAKLWFQRPTLSPSRGGGCE